RKLGNFFRLTVPAAPPPPAPRLDYSTPAVARDPAAAAAAAQQYYGSEGGRASEAQAQARRRKRRTPMEQPLPYFMHGGRSPADSWHSRLSRPGSTRRFTTATATATVESAPSPRSGSTISIIARRFMGPFLSEPNSEAATTVDGGGLLQRRLSWRSYKLLTAGSRPATPPSSRNASPEGRGRSKSREEEMSIPGAVQVVVDEHGAAEPLRWRDVVAVVAGARGSSQPLCVAAVPRRGNPRVPRRGDPRVPRLGDPRVRRPGGPFRDAAAREQSRQQ
ncbi:hypothetical protein CIB48_g8451, partial [Xylaria polymorpha]